MLFENIPTTTVQLYPSIGMRHGGESVRANFGQAPFRYAIADHVRDRRDAVWSQIMEIPDPMPDLCHEDTEEAREHKARLYAAAEEETRATLRELVMGYLAHHGFASTAKAFREQCAKDERMSASTSASVMDSADAAMDTDDGLYAGPFKAAQVAGASDHHESSETRDLQTRLSILQAVRAGDIDRALEELQTHYPQALNSQDGLLLFHLRCRKFVELVLKAGAALRKVKEAEMLEKEKLADGGPPPAPVPDDGTLDGEGAMDVDDPSPEALSASAIRDLSDGSLLLPSAAPTLADSARDALHTALAYGQALEADYKSDTRPAVKAHRLRVFGLVAYEDPENEGGEVGALAGQEARVQLAGEVNQAILRTYTHSHEYDMLADNWCAESQGKPVHPALETLVRQAGACVVQLGLQNVGRAAFADVRQELLEA